MAASTRCCERVPNRCLIQEAKPKKIIDGELYLLHHVRPSVGDLGRFSAGTVSSRSVRLSITHREKLAVKCSTIVALQRKASFIRRRCLYYDRRALVSILSIVCNRARCRPYASKASG